MNQVIKYKNGLRLVVDYIPFMRSVAAGIWVGTGSSKETPQTNGISHFTEHMMFKGTKKFSPFQIANEFESMGAMVNAFTGKENTCYYVKSVDEYCEKCFSILSEILLNSSFPPDELNKERKVIVEEINMVEDAPEDICFDLLSASLYPNKPLGKTILGPIENVQRFTRDDITAYMAQAYTASNLVVAVAGNMKPEDADKMVRKYLLPYLSDSQNVEKVPSCPNYAVKSNYVKRVKDFEQSNIAISYPSLKFNDSQFSTQAVLNMILGGGMSSRLFQIIREKLGLAYSVFTSPTSYMNNGSFNILLNITAKNTEKVIHAVRKEILALLKEGIQNEEFARAKAQLKSACVFSQESMQTIMNSIGKLMVMSDEVYSIDKKIADFEAVTMDDVNNFAQKLFKQDNLCAAYVGKDVSTDILGLMKEI